MVGRIPGSDSQSLIRFLEIVERLLDNTVNTWKESLLSEEVREDAREIFAAIRPSFVRARTVLPVLVAQLEEAGLTGEQLEIKLRWFNNILVEFLRRPTIEDLLDVLDAINKILGSLKSVPGVEQIKETKEWLELLIKRFTRNNTGQLAPPNPAVEPLD